MRQYIHPSKVDHVNTVKVRLVKTGVATVEVPNMRGNNRNGIFCCNRNIASGLSWEYNMPAITTKYSKTSKATHLFRCEENEVYFWKRITNTRPGKNRGSNSGVAKI